MSVRAVSIIIMCVFGFVSVGFTQSTKAATTKPKAATQVKKTSTLKDIQGEVTWISKSRLSLNYSTDAGGLSDREIMFPLTPSVKVQRIGGLNEIRIGDTVSVQYDETIEEGPGGKSIRRTAKVVSFVKPAAQKPAYGGEGEVIQSTASSDGVVAEY